MACRSGQSFSDPYDLSKDGEKYLMPNEVAETTPGWSDRAACLLTAARLHFNSPPDWPQNWGQINPNLNDYHSNPKEISNTFWLLDITDWWWKPEETHAKYADLSNVACDIFSIIPHSVGVDASFSLGRHVIGWRRSKTTGGTLCKKVVVRPYARANDGLLAGNNPVLDPTITDNDMDMHSEAEHKKLHWMAKVHDFLAMWQGSYNMRAAQKESRAENEQMTAVGSISGTEEIVKASWSHLQHAAAAAFHCQKNHLCHQLCLQRTSLQDELKYWMSSKSNELTAILPKVMRLVHLKAFQTPKIALTGMGSWIFQTPAKPTGRQIMNQIWNWTMAVRIQTPWSGGMWVPNWIFPDWFGLYNGQSA